jgi:hypothetical protein
MVFEMRCHKFKGSESYLGQKHPPQAAEAEVEAEAKASMDTTLHDFVRGMWSNL